MPIMRFIAIAVSAFFGFISGVVRNARTLHPDGRTFLGTVRAEADDQRLLGAGKLLEGQVLLRIGIDVTVVGVRRHVRAPHKGYECRSCLPNAVARVTIAQSGAKNPIVRGTDD
jgi:hypothetical protein